VGLNATAIDNNLEYIKDIALIERMGSTKVGLW
jgi:hypothetical protein